MANKNRSVLQKIGIVIASIIIGGVLMAFIILPGSNRDKAYEKDTLDAIQTEQINNNAESLMAIEGDIQTLEEDMKGVATKGDVKESREIVMKQMEMLFNQTK